MKLFKLQTTDLQTTQKNTDKYRLVRLQLAEIQIGDRLMQPALTDELTDWGSIHYYYLLTSRFI